MTDVTELLEAIQKGQPQAADALLPLVYDELRKLARHKLRQEHPGQTLQATALVHEAYLRLVGPGVRNQESGVSGNSAQNEELTAGAGRPTPAFDGRGHLFAAAAEAMRRI